MEHQAHVIAISHTALDTRLSKSKWVLVSLSRSPGVPDGRHEDLEVGGGDGGDGVAFDEGAEVFESLEQLLHLRRHPVVTCGEGTKSDEDEETKGK